MSTLKHPVGPQSSKVYWRRRLTVGLGLIAVIVVIILIVVRPGSSSGEPSDQKTPAPASTSTSSAKPAADSTTIPTDAVEADGAACKDDKLVVTAVTDLDSYTADQKPKLSLSIVNTGSKPCVVNAGSSQQVFTITSGDEVYWLSTDCQKAAVDADVTLEPGKPLTSAAPLTWDRTRSSTDSCDSDREAVPAGGASYKLAVTVGDVTSKPTQFLLN